MTCTFQPLALSEVILITPRVFADARGFFLEAHKQSEYRAAGITAAFVQTNASRSARGVLRGLHYQLQPQAQGKLVQAVRGAIFDVAVDVRRDSPTYAQWVAETLSEDNHRLLYIPPGFAHGFCVLSEVADVIYQVTAEYSAALDRGIVWDDPEIGVAWPISAPLLSAKDAALPRLCAADVNFSR